MSGSGEPSAADRVQEEPRRTIDEMFAGGDEIQRALERAAREARMLHKRLGRPIVVWQDGRVVELRPEEIPD